MTTSVTIQSGETGATAPETPAVTPQVDPAAATTETTPAKVERPAWLPEKFKDPEQMALAYGELEKMLGQGKTEEPAKTDETPKAPTQEEAEKQLTAKGIDVSALSAEFAKDGKLSDESYKKLQDGGFSKEVVDGYIAGQHAIAEKFVGELHGLAGGSDNYQAMITWAANNLSAEQKAAFNGAMTKDMATATLAVSGLKAQYEASEGKSPALIGGKGGDGTDVFRSRQEQVAAIRDPRYGKDPAYTQDVQNKALRSFN